MFNQFGLIPLDSIQWFPRYLVGWVEWVGWSVYAMIIIPLRGPSCKLGFARIQMSWISRWAECGNKGEQSLSFENRKIEIYAENYFPLYQFENPLYCHTRSYLKFQLSWKSEKPRLARWATKWYVYLNLNHPPTQLPMLEMAISWQPLVICSQNFKLKQSGQNW